MKVSALKILATAAFAAIAVSPALAADMPVKARPAIVEVWTWDKWYVGLNGGYSWGRSDTSGTFYNNNTGAQLSPTQYTRFDLNGGVFGGQIGKNWQNGKWVFGIEADGQWSGERGSALFTCVTPNAAFGGNVCNPNTANINTLGLSPTTTFNQEIAWFATFRGRVGGLITPTALLYVTGGAAVAGIKTSGVLTGVTTLGALTSVAWGNDSTNWGWVVGAGLEARLGGNWTGKIEGLYMDLGSVSGAPVLLPSTPPLRFGYSSHVTDVVVRAGVNYHFGGPVVAKY
ncbi:outer membrane beta-barrel protein [Bradyrhizobium sp.]|uniref:outer membrane protein n=1 Tax=Bradyrhizobium sp. TaxID=376 RepID=UPI001DDBECEB|nr:outer membrane beta-barrel protein [Bradyrhizobium sp.]MBI5321011.1 porin family protein [Bradyrhizobium sp.]